MKSSASASAPPASSGISYSSLLAAELNSVPMNPAQSHHNSVQRQLKFNSNAPGTNNITGVATTNSAIAAQRRRRLYFKPKTSGHSDSDGDSDRDQRGNHETSDDSDSDDDAELLKDFDIIDVIPGFGEPPRNNQEYEIKFLKSEQEQLGGNSSKAMQYTKYTTSQAQFSNKVEIRDDHFRKPLTKIDVLKAPDNYPCPLNVYCVQEITLNWFLYGGNDFETSHDASTNETMSEGMRIFFYFRKRRI